MREDLTFSFDGFFTGAYRDIPLAQDVQRERRRGERGRHALLAGRRHDARQQRRAGQVRRRAAAAGPAHRLALPAGRRSADVHAALPPARRRDRPRRRGRGGSAGLGQPVEVRAPAAHGERARGRRAARHARLDRAGLARPPPDRAPRRGAVRRRRRAGPAQRDAARALPALGARAGRALRPRTCTTTSCPPRSRASRPPPPAPSATSASSRTRSTTRGPGSSPPSSSRSSRPELLGGIGYWRFGREHPTGSAPRSTCTSRRTTWRLRSCRRCSRSESSPAATRWPRRCSSSCAAGATR